MNINKSNRFMPLLMALCVVVGILIGTFYANHFSGNRLNIINSGSNRLSNLLHIVDDQYVDKVNIDSLVDMAIPQILADLDPHSVYIPAKDAQAVTDDLKGSFSGVGIEFTIRKDTIHVQNVVKNGPAQRAGILAGDKIVSVDGKTFVGKVVTQDEAMRRLKGPKDTKVKIGVVRYGQKAVKYFTVTRGDIPQRSITATYMLDKSTGYIKIKNFGETTYPELLIALAQLSQERFSNLVIDLRDNGGGYMNSAVQMANEFLPKNKLIVYMQGRKSPRQDFRSDGHGSYQKIPLIVLINEALAPGFFGKASFFSNTLRAVAIVGSSWLMYSVQACSSSILYMMRELMKRSSSLCDLRIIRLRRFSPFLSAKAANCSTVFWLTRYLDISIILL